MTVGHHTTLGQVGVPRSWGQVQGHGSKKSNFENEGWNIHQL